MNVMVVFSYDITRAKDMSVGVFGVEVVPFVFDAEGVPPFYDLDGGCFVFAHHFTLSAQ